MRSRFLVGLAVIVSLAHAAQKPQKWLEIRSAHFRAITSGAERPARRILAQFEQLRAALGGLGLGTDFGAPVILLIAKDEPARADHICITVRDDSAAALHEYLHQVEERTFRPMPLWLHEGLAEYHSQLPAAIAPRLKVPQPLPLEALRAVDFSSSLYNEAARSSLFYAESWALVQMLLGDPASKAQFLPYLQLLRVGTLEGEAWSHVYGDGKALENQFRAYMAKGQFSTPPWLGRVTEESAAARELPAAEALALKEKPQSLEAHAAQAEALLKQPARLDEALAEARKAAELWPGSNENQLRIGRVLLAMRRNGEAAAVARRVASEARSAPQQAAALELAEQIRKLEQAQSDQKQAAEVARLEKQRTSLREELAKKKRQSRRPLPAAFGLAEGTIGSTSCRMPWILDIEIKNAKDAVKLQALDFRSVDYTSSGWDPPADFNACRDLQGRPARVYFSPVKEASYAGEILIVEVIKPPAPPPKKKAPPKKKSK
jgi:tetratricopeptide (TPR) repeat protein